MTAGTGRPARSGVSAVPGDQVVNVFIASEHSTPAKMQVLWTVSEADGRAICDDPRTRWEHSSLHWTALERCGERGRDWAYRRDDGRQDELFNELGVTVLGCASRPYEGMSGA